jgi:hypothetical protein
MKGEARRGNQETENGHCRERDIVKKEKWGG